MRGTVIQRGKGWSICYYIGKDEHGKWLQKWESGFSTKKEAQRVLRTRIDMVENSFSNNLSRSTVAGYLNYWLKVYCEPKLAPNTINGYRTNIEKHAAKCRACKNRLCHARTFFHRDYNGHIFARSDGYAGGRNK